MDRNEQLWRLELQGMGLCLHAGLGVSFLHYLCIPRILLLRIVFRKWAVNSFTVRNVLSISNYDTTYFFLLLWLWKAFLRSNKNAVTLESLKIISKEAGTSFWSLSLLSLQRQARPLPHGSSSIMCLQATHNAHRRQNEDVRENLPCHHWLHIWSPSSHHLSSHIPNHTGLCWSNSFVILFHLCRPVILVRENVSLESSPNWHESYRQVF